jgi:hypothetical protein
MGMRATFDALKQVVLPTGRLAPPTGVSETSTYNPSNQVVTVPAYRDHLSDLVTTRVSTDSKKLLKDLFHHDPDVSASVNAYLTVANASEPVFIAYDQTHQIDRNGQKQLMDVLVALTTDSDYKQGFRMLDTVRTISEAMRYMLLLRGACAQELVLDKLKLPSEVRTIDVGSLEFQEKTPGVYKPIQLAGQGRRISLDVPTVFISYFHRDPTDVYSYSHFVSCINTIASRQHVMNTLYRIMQVTGFPRMELKVLEEVVMKSAPADVLADPAKKQAYFNSIMSNVSSVVTNLRPEQAFVHGDSIEVGTVNQQRQGAEVNIDSVISNLNDQNQAALKTMGTVIGRGESGVNTGSVEARIFAMNTDELNNPVGECWERILTLAMRLLGFQGYVRCYFQPVELRPDLELEPQRVMKQTRLLKDLSLGLITDDEYHMSMYNRLAPDNTPLLSGTGFESGGGSGASISPNADPLGRSLAPDGSKQANGNQFKPKKATVKKP